MDEELEFDGTGITTVVLRSLLKAEIVQNLARTPRPFLQSVMSSELFTLLKQLQIESENKLKNLQRLWIVSVLEKSEKSGKIADMFFLWSCRTGKLHMTLWKN